uniref:Evolutionarily conserved signaling intermediate in Toll pathway, mitochondrial n=1 Tax=Heterorhabditis bacteriophora TaxID=37862 RepID=A0A1I7WN20_HETBA
MSVAYISRNLFVFHRKGAALACFSRMLSVPSKEQNPGLVHINKQFESVPPLKRNKEAFMAAICKFLYYIAVQPDKEIHDIVVNAFGEWNFATRKIKRMLYWMPKLKHSNKYLDRRLVEGKSLSPAELAGIALKMMSRDPGTTLSLTKLPTDEISGYSPWFATAQSLTQKNLLSWLPWNTEIFIDGPFRVYVMEHPVYYITMTCKPLDIQYNEFKCEEFDEDFSHWFLEWKTRLNERKQSVHEQKEETILALGVLHKNNNQTASVWLEELQKTNPMLSKMKMRMRLDKATT